MRSGNTDSFRTRIDMAKLLHNLKDDEVLTVMISDDKIAIIDINAILKALTVVPQTIGTLAKYMFDQLPKVMTVDFVTDSYHEKSVRQDERRRGLHCKWNMHKSSS